MGDPGIQTSLVRAIHNGIQVLAQVNGLALDIYLIVQDVDFDRIPDILPKARFEQDGQIHVSSLGLEDEPVEDEMESILANMDSDDTVLFSVPTPRPMILRLILSTTQAIGLFCRSVSAFSCTGKRQPGRSLRAILTTIFDALPDRPAPARQVRHLTLRLATLRTTALLSCSSSLTNTDIFSGLAAPAAIHAFWRASGRHRIAAAHRRAQSTRAAA